MGHILIISSALITVLTLHYASPVLANTLELTIDEADTFKAIRTLHTKLDVDADGEVDDHESKKYLDSAGSSNSGAYSNANKLRYLHQDGKDRSISVDELWQAWKGSQVHNWTTDETIYWLSNYVELPEYSHVFQQLSINGTSLPRLAADSHFLNKLGIADISAKKKISIKAMDVVLFGPPKLGNSGKFRDIIVGLVTVICISTCCVFYKKSLQSQRAMQDMQHHLDNLQKAEDQMHDLQFELDKALKAQEAVVTEKKNLEHQLEMQRQFSASSNLSEQNNKLPATSNGSSTNGDREVVTSSQVIKLEEEIKALRMELDETYKSIEAKQFRAPHHLRSLLRATYTIESQHYNEKKSFLEQKANEVKTRNQKLQKKKTSFLGYYKVAQENCLEEDLNAIVEVKEKIMQITKEIKERTERWRAIEELCNCSLDLTPCSKLVINT